MQTFFQTFLFLRLIQLVLHKQTSWFHFHFKSNMFNGLKKTIYISLTYMSVANDTSFTKATLNRVQHSTCDEVV